jgi:hemerythrin superfamily protein
MWNKSVPNLEERNQAGKVVECITAIQKDMTIRAAGIYMHAINCIAQWEPRSSQVSLRVAC